MSEFKILTLRKTNISWSSYIYSLYSPREQRNCIILYGYGDYIGSIYRVTTFLFFLQKLVFKEGGRLEFDFLGKCGLMTNYHIMTEYKRQSLTKKNISWSLYIYTPYIVPETKEIVLFYMATGTIWGVYIE